MKQLRTTGEEGNWAASGGHRSPRSLGAQPAQQALCKVRTEVVEVTRSMLDRSNANFLLWPPCVEVQRCSGCCNTKSLRCVPFRSNTRYLQVMKVEYINKSPTYAKAVVSVVDHVECRCQPAPAPKKKSSRRQNGPHKEQHRNQTVGHGQVKLHSKDELHHRDGLKQNQGSHLQDLLQHHWGPRGDTFTHHEGFSLAKGDPVLGGPLRTSNSTGQSGGNQTAVAGDGEELVGTGLTATSTSTTQKPAAPAAPRPPAHPKRRMRKNRRRISKAAMRAMLM
ncbi:uncharacterized protein pdgfbb [Neosynchiropus ocellatus]